MSEDRSFCAISAQAGKPTPTVAEVDSIHGRYNVMLYSGDSGRVLERLDITLSRTDTLHRFYQEILNSGGGLRWVRRKVPVVAYGDERSLKSKQAHSVPSVALYYSDKPVVSVFQPPECSNGICSIEGMETGLLLNIKQVKPSGFAGTVDQVGTPTSEQVAGRPTRLLGPHFFCALRER
jgi:hypothetical protein